MREVGTSGRDHCRNSCADPKTSARKPTERISLLRASRTDVSSSTMQTRGSISVISALRLLQGKLKNRSVWRTVRDPQTAAVGFHNRMADRQSHSNPLSFGGKKRFENLIGLLGTDPFS